MKKFTIFFIFFYFIFNIEGNAYANKISYICQYENKNGKLVGDKTLYEIKNNRVFEDTYEVKEVKNLEISKEIISFTYNPKIQGYKDTSYHKVNLKTGNFYKISYLDNGGANTSFGKCKNF